MKEMKMTDWLLMVQNAAQMLLVLAIELSLLFLLISTGVNWLRCKVPNNKIQTIMGSRQGKGYLIASLLGAITPFCSCSTIPMLRGMLQARAGFGPTLTFLFVSPLLNPIIIGLMWATFGWKITTLYSLIALSVSVVAGWALNKLEFSRFVIPMRDNAQRDAISCPSASLSKPQEAQEVSGNMKLQIQLFSPTTTSCRSNSAIKSPSQKRMINTICCSPKQNSVRRTQWSSSVLKSSFAEAWQQFKKVAPYLIIGILIGSIIYGFVPAEWISNHAGSNNPFAIILSAVIGIPLYIRAEAVIPLASVLLGKGMSIGAVMALIIGSAGASITEVILLKSMFRMPMIVAFVSIILGMAILMGYIALLFF
ncbi:hypothetical protein CPU03_15640 [Edwardsiella tarda]|nr:hypothetical protein CPU03_15640 [Edwardsiella tarda]